MKNSPVSCYGINFDFAMLTNKKQSNNITNIPIQVIRVKLNGDDVWGFH